MAKIAACFDREYGDIWRSAYSEEPERWYEHHPLRMREWYALNLIKNEPRGLAVDLGCGNGHTSLQMKKAGFDPVIGVDISSEMLTAARELAQASGLSGAIEFIEGDVQDLPPIESETVQVCTALGVIEYLDEDAPLLAEVHRILRPGGVLVIQTRNYRCINARTYETIKRVVPNVGPKINYREHRPDAFRRSVVEHGFTVERECFSHFYPLYPLNLTPVVRHIVRPFNNVLSKACERFAYHRFSKNLASMHIMKLRKIGAR